MTTPDDDHRLIPAGSRSLVRLQRSSALAARGRQQALELAKKQFEWLVAAACDDGSLRLWELEQGIEILTVWPHTNYISHVAFSPDCNRFATASADGVKVWDVDTGQELLTFRGHRDWVHSVVFSPNGTRLASASGDPMGGNHTVKIWDADTGHEQESLPLKAPCSTSAMTMTAAGLRFAWASFHNSVEVCGAQGQELISIDVTTREEFGRNDCCVALSPDATRLALASHHGMENEANCYCPPGSVTVWDMETGHENFKLNEQDLRLKSLTFSPDGTRLAILTQNGVKLWDTATGDEVFHGEEHPDVGRPALSFSPDGSRVVTAGGTDGLNVWDLVTGLRMLWPCHSEANGVAFGRRSIARNSRRRDHTLSIPDVVENRADSIIKGHDRKIIGAWFSSDGMRLATVTEEEKKVWDAATGAEVFSVDKMKSSFSSDLRRLVSSDGMTVKVWDTTTRHELLSLEGHTDKVWCCAFSADGTRLASSSPGPVHNTTVKVWNAITGNEILSLKRADTYAPYDGLVFSVDGVMLASNHVNKAITVWDTVTGEEILSLTNKCVGTNRMVFNADGSQLAVQTTRGLELWDVGTGEETFSKVHSPDSRGYPPSNVAFSPDGTLIASVSNWETVKLWDVVTGGEAFTFKGHTGIVSGLAFSPDGTHLASASTDCTVKVWDLASGNEAVTLIGNSWFHCVGFSPDGQRLVAGNAEGAVSAWDFATLVK